MVFSLVILVDGYILIFLLRNTDLVTRKLLKETHKNEESRRVCPAGKVWG